MINEIDILAKLEQIQLLVNEVKAAILLPPEISSKVDINPWSDHEGAVIPLHPTPTKGVSWQLIDDDDEL